MPEPAAKHHKPHPLKLETRPAAVPPPGVHLQVDRMPGHWLLARLGKRVLRPGGRRLTRALLDRLAITSADRVVEFAPGLGTTAAEVLRRRPRHYLGIEQDDAAARWARARLPDLDSVEICLGSAEHAELPDASADVALGEAILTITTPKQKRAIVSEAHRILAPGGRYGIHELVLVPDDMDPALRDEMEGELTRTIHVGARPLTRSEWNALLEAGGFRVTSATQAPMRLLDLSRLLADEGLPGTLRLAWNTLRTRGALRRVLAMYVVFRKYRHHMRAIAIVAVRSEAG
ncbi:MAG: methyltransferase domain-containing protein [Nevskiaceae bacterium]|nr:MAG: methyltransferase domain-containing protein [Nevskiaceae bacterium]TBR71653.1 MAG: methyltransferase domain-containing protein [Nevskiaceae bacterium]